MEAAYLDTGAMYRAIALAALRCKVNLNDSDALLDVAHAARVELDCGPTHTRVRLDGHDVSEAIRTMAVSAATSAVARHTGIRQLLVSRQRAIGRGLKSFVSEGRDQGSVVFPDADAKFVLDGTVETRANRRLRELLADGEAASYEDVLQSLRERDDNDFQQWKPLLDGGEAIVIDTTHMTIHDVIDRLAEHLRTIEPCS